MSETLVHAKENLVDNPGVLTTHSLGGLVLVGDNDNSKGRDSCGALLGWSKRSSCRYQGREAGSSLGRRTWRNNF